MLTKDRIKPDADKVDVVEKISSLKSRKEFECQLGMFTYVSVLTSSFTKDCLNEAFTKLKKMITDVLGPVQYYDPSKPVRVQVDASQ